METNEGNCVEMVQVEKNMRAQLTGVDKSDKERRLAMAYLVYQIQNVLLARASSGKEHYYCLYYNKMIVDSCVYIFREH